MTISSTSIFISGRHSCDVFANLHGILRVGTEPPMLTKSVSFSDPLSKTNPGATRDYLYFPMKNKGFIHLFLRPHGIIRI
jgi:hypothetical protein